jgi:hypothetical protein
MNDNGTKNHTKKILIFAILATISLIIAFWKIGLGLGFWIILILWCIELFFAFIRPLIKISLIFWGTLIIVFTFSMLWSFGVIFKSNSKAISGNVIKSNDGIILSECTSTASDTPVMLDGWKSTIYVAALSQTTSPDASEANDVRTFSYKGIKNKTEANSLYSRIEKSDGSYITGFGTTMEVCDANNKTSKSYATLDTDYVASENVVASTHYFHGGNYIHGTGDYRADIYIKTPDGKWHLVDRMSGLTVTE